MTDSSSEYTYIIRYSTGTLLLDKQLSICQAWTIVVHLSIFSTISFYIISCSYCLSFFSCPLQSSNMSKFSVLPTETSRTNFLRQFQYNPLSPLQMTYDTTQIYCRLIISIPFTLKPSLPSLDTKKCTVEYLSLLFKNLPFSWTNKKLEEFTIFQSLWMSKFLLIFTISELNVRGIYHFRLKIYNQFIVLNFGLSLMLIY